MEIFCGTYRWDGTKTGEGDPIAWFPGAYDVRLYRLSSGYRNIRHLRPYLCIFAATGQGQSVSANPEKFAKQICRDFTLQLERVLWVEDLLVGPNRYEVVMFSRSGQLGQTVFYRSSRRLASRREIQLLEREAKR